MLPGYGLSRRWYVLCLISPIYRVTTDLTIIDGHFPDTCPLCFDDMTRGSIFRRLPCNHLMHKECIDKWLCTQDGSCPFCRETFYHMRKPLVVRKSAVGATAMMYVDDEDDKDQLEMGRAAFMLWLKGLFRRV